jgi:cell division protein FtsL
VRDFDVPLKGRPHREGSVSGSRTARDAEDFDETCGAAQRRGRESESAFAKRETAVCGKSMSMRKQKTAAMREFRTVKRIDNSRLVRHVEPAKQKNLYKTAGLGGIVAVFFLFYIFQHFRCIDLSFELEDLKAQQAKTASLNSELKLEIANLRDPMRIDVIARRQLGLTQPLPIQVREYDAPSAMQVVAVRFGRRNHGQ